MLDFLRRLQEQGPAVAAVMHLRKLQDGDKKLRAGQRVAGSRHFHSFLDSALYLDRDKPADGAVKVTVEHRDEEVIDPFTLELEAEGSVDGPVFRLQVETTAAALRGRSEELRRRAVEVSRELGPVSMTKLATSLGVAKRMGLEVVRDCLDLRLLERSEDGRDVLAPSEPFLEVPATPNPVGTEPPSTVDKPHGKAA